MQVLVFGVKHENRRHSGDMKRLLVLVPLACLSLCSCESETWKKANYLQTASSNLYKSGFEKVVIDSSTKILEIEDHAEAYYMRGTARDDLGQYSLAKLR